MIRWEREIGHRLQGDEVVHTVHEHLVIEGETFTGERQPIIMYEDGAVWVDGNMIAKEWRDSFPQWQRRK